MRSSSFLILFEANDKISLLLSKFDPEPDQSLFIFNYEDVDNAEIVNSSFLESPINIDKITNIFNFDDFKDCFDKTDLYVEEPYDPIQQELAIIFERFQMSGSNVFNLTDPNSFRLCFLIASIMVNTLRDFTTLQSTFPLYSMLDELSLSFISPVIPELLILTNLDCYLSSFCFLIFWSKFAFCLKSID